MDYEKHYRQLIQKAQSRSLEGYVEKHHIVPKAFGGTNDPKNLVELTSREHFIAHLLLYKLQTSKRKRHQMLTAVVMMAGREKYNSVLYEKARLAFSQAQAARISGENSMWLGSHRVGEQNPFYGKQHSEENKKIMSDVAKNKVSAVDTITGQYVKISKELFDSSERYVGVTFGTKRSEETRFASGAFHRGTIYVNDGIFETRIEKCKLSEYNEMGYVAGRLKITCPHCGKQCDIPNAKHWHFDNCKKLKKLNV